MRFIYRLLPAIFISFSITTFAQVASHQDTSEYPYWVEMMQDPSVNFYKTLEAFETYWEDREITKGAGYKPFMRWAANMQELIDEDGNIPSSETILKWHRNYQRGGSIDGPDGIDVPGGPGGSGNTIPPGTPPGQGPGKCLTSGNWIEIGPNFLPGNKTSQPNGLGRINALAFHPTDSNIIYAGAPAGGLWVTKDHGQSWSTTTDTLITLGISSIAIDPDHPDTIYLGTGDRDASDAYGVGVLKSTDGGISWKQANANMGYVTVGKLIIDPNNTNVLIAACHNGVWRTSNGGDSWTRIITGHYRDVVFNPGNTNHVYAARYNPPEFYRSTDNGANFTKITNGISSGGRRAAIGVTPDDTNFVYYLVTNQRTYRAMYLSTDQGASFTQMSNTPNIMDYSHTGSGNSGQAWYDLDIAVDPLDKSVVYVGGVNIFKSTDSATTWKISGHWVGSGGADDIHADQHVLEYSPTDGYLYVGNDGGVYVTKDSGVDYIDISQGMGIAQIYRLSQSRQSANWLINGYQDNGTGMLQNGSWKTVMGGDGMYCQIDPTTDNYAYSNLYYGDVRRYTNGTYSGKIAANGVNSINEGGAWITPFVLQEGTPSTMFIGYKNVWRSTNIKASSAGNVSWTKISNGLAGKNNQNIRHLENSAADPAVLYMSRYDNTLFRTDNANAATPTWTNLSSGLPAAGNVVWIESDPRRENTVWIVRQNKVYESTDKGSSWTNITNGIPTTTILCLKFDSSSSKRGLYAGTYFGVYYKDTTMSQWVWFNENMPTTSRVRDLDIYYHPTDRSKSHIVAATYGRGNWRSPLYDEDQNPPIAEFEASDTFTCANEVLRFTDRSLYNPTRWKWEIRPSNVTFVKGDSLDQEVEVLFHQPGSYSIKLIVDNCAGIDSIEYSGYIQVGDTITPAACVPGSNNVGTSIGIREVKIDTTSYTSGSSANDGAYLDMTCTNIFYLKTDTSYHVDFETGPTYNERVIAFIDFNNDGDFQDAGELVAHTALNKPSHSDTIKIPATANVGEVLRMRVRSDYNGVATDPCSDLSYGHTEDYGVRLSHRRATPRFLVSRDSSCVNDTITLTDQSEGPITGWEWVIFKPSGNDTLIGPGPHTITVADSGWTGVELNLNDRRDTTMLDSAIYGIAVPVVGTAILSGTAAGCENRSVELQATDTVSLGAKFSWLRDGALVLGRTNDSLQLNSLSYLDSGTYQVVADHLGCADTSAGIHLSVFPVPNVDFVSDSTSQCEGNNKFTFTNQSSLVYGIMNYDWDFNAEGNKVDKDPAFRFTSAGTKDVKLVVETDRGCTDSLIQQVEVRISPMADFTLTPGDSCFKNHELNAVNSSSTSAGTLSYDWDFGNGLGSNQTSPSHQYAMPGTYTITLVVAANQCLDTAIATYTVHPDPVADFTVDQTELCIRNAQIELTDGSGISGGSISQLSWNFGDGNTTLNGSPITHQYLAVGNYTVELEVTSDQNCKDTATQDVNVWHNPVANFNLPEDTFCFVNHAVNVVNLSSIGAGNVVNQTWDWGDGNTSTDKDPADYSYSAPGDYLIELAVESNKACKDTTQMTVSILENPIIAFNGGTVCLGEILNFENNSNITNGTISEFNWRFGDGRRSSQQEPGHEYRQRGTYDVELWARTSDGCKDSLLVNGSAVVQPIPTAAFTYEVLESWLNETNVEFTDQSIDADGIEWDFGSNQTETEPQVTISFTDTGSIAIRLVATNSLGCSDTLLQDIFVYPTNEGMVVTAFSPNDDGINDDFGIAGLQFVKSFELNVYNRWGALVYSTTEITDRWDGTYVGNPAADGMYVFTVEYIDLSGNYHKKNGVVRLIR
jgi:gliding motility-associated-like protein